MSLLGPGSAADRRHDFSRFSISSKTALGGQKGPRQDLTVQNAAQKGPRGSPLDMIYQPNINQKDEARDLNTP